MTRPKTKAMMDYETALRKAICQYCLDVGHGIDDENRERAMTTNAEKIKAKEENREPRYVIIRAIENFENHKRPRQVLELLKNHYDLIDWDEWQKLQDILGIELSCKSAQKIINIISEDTSVSETRTVMDIWYNIHDPGSAELLTKFIYEFVPDTCRDNVIAALLNDGIDIHKLIESRKSDSNDMGNAKYPIPEYPAEFPISW